MSGLTTDRVRAGLDKNGLNLDRDPVGGQQGSDTSTGVKGVEAAATGNRQRNQHGAHVLRWRQACRQQGPVMIGAAMGDGCGRAGHKRRQGCIGHQERQVEVGGW
uniref:Uncharacterized protein n=1 Tax=Oryza brachyantha TaxID=4533 RepID=J3KZV9_ORYBR